MLDEEAAPGSVKAMPGVHPCSEKEASSSDSSAVPKLQIKGVLEGALEWAARGIPVFPCRNAPGQDGHKAPLTARGFKDATTDAAQIEAWFRKHPDALVGVPTGAISGLAVLDIDAKNGKDGFDHVPGWETRSPLRSRTGSGGAHLFFRASELIRSTSNVNGFVGVDTRGEGGYVIVPPSEGYEWTSGGNAIDPTLLPHFPADYLPRYRHHDSSDEGLVADDPQLVEPALSAVPNDDLNWDDWNRIAMAIFAATGGSDEGFEAFDAWSQKCDKYSVHETNKRWRDIWRSPPTQIGMGTIFWEAFEADPDWLYRYELEQEAAAIASFEAGEAAFLGMTDFKAAKPSSEPVRPIIDPAEPKTGETPSEDGAGGEKQTDPDRAEPKTSETPSEDGAGDQKQSDPDPNPADPSGTTEGPSSLLGEWDAGHDKYIIPPRAWLLGNTYCRQFVSSLLATGGGGKTAMRILQAISCATGRELTGEKVFKRCRVLYVSLEDDADELRRRVRAAMIYHGIPAEELEGWLYLAAPGQKAGKLVTSEPAKRSRGKQDARVHAGQMLEEINRTVAARKIDLILIDPLVKAHDVEENDNTAMDFVISTLTTLAIENNIAVDVLHHTSKGAADPGNADRGRGASAVNNGARLVYTLATMSVEEARAFQIAETDRRSFIRIDSGKVNIAPPLRDAKWFQIVGVDLRNSSSLYPSGDNVQTVVPWTPPQALDGVTDDMRQSLLAEIKAGVPEGIMRSVKGKMQPTKPGSRYSVHHNSDWRDVCTIVHRHVPGKSDTQARQIIKSMIDGRVLIEDEYADPNTSKAAKGLRLRTEKDDRNDPM